AIAPRSSAFSEPFEGKPHEPAPQGSWEQKGRLDMADASLLRVTATPAALDLIALLRAEHGDVLFHQSGGCCDGSAPMCYPVSDYLVGDRDVHLGEIGGAQVYINRDQFEYWKHTQLIIDAVAGRGGMFSLENGSGKRFLT